MLLPASRLHDGWNRNALRPAQHTDGFGLFRVCPWFGLGHFPGVFILVGLTTRRRRLFLIDLSFDDLNSPVATADAVTTTAPRRPMALAGREERGEIATIGGQIDS
jgi:hypothetical protein